MMTSLRKIRWICRSFHFVNRKTRLVVEYVLVAILITTAGTAASLWFEQAAMTAQLQAVQGKVVVIESVNEKQELTIHDLDIRHAELKGKLSDLEKSDEALKNYLSQPLPGKLGCMLPGAKPGCK